VAGKWRSRTVQGPKHARFVRYNRGSMQWKCTRKLKLPTAERVLETVPVDWSGISIMAPSLPRLLRERGSHMPS
jgi:hypothetical protein